LIKKWHIVLLTIIAVGAMLLSGCSSEPKVKTGDSVKVDYTGKLTDGTVFDSSIGETPLEFIVGAGEVIQGFDAAVIGMKVGETKTVTIPPDQAYGERTNDLIVTVERNLLPADVVPVVGGLLQTSHQGTAGQTVVILEVTDTTVTVDANAPLAGETLVFEIKLLEITPKK
jgi:peptidylprolyl isomerase